MNSHKPLAMIKVVTWNIDTNEGSCAGYAYDSHPEWHVAARMPDIELSLAELVRGHDPDAILIQEMRKGPNALGLNVDSVEPVTNWLDAHGYAVVQQKYNESPAACWYLTAIHRARWVIVQVDVRYFSQTPDRPTDHENHAARLDKIKAHNFGEEYERCALLVLARNNQSNQEVWLTNVHLAMRLQARVESCRLLAQIASERRGPQLMLGDFNMLREDDPEVQLGALRRVMAELQLTVRGEPVDWSFVAFVYDFADSWPALDQAHRKVFADSLLQSLRRLDPKERRERVRALFETGCKAQGGWLDRCFVSDLRAAVAKLLLLPSRPDLFNGAEDSFSEASLKQYVLACEAQAVPAFASDHQPVLVTGCFK